MIHYINPCNFTVCLLSSRSLQYLSQTKTADTLLTQQRFTHAHTHANRCTMCTHTDKNTQTLSVVSVHQGKCIHYRPQDITELYDLISQINSTGVAFFFKANVILFYIIHRFISVFLFKRNKTELDFSSLLQICPRKLFL